MLMLFSPEKVELLPQSPCGNTCVRPSGPSSPTPPPASSAGRRRSGARRNAAPGPPALSMSYQLRVLGPRLDDELGLERANDLSGPGPPLFVSKPAMWSVCRWVAITAVELRAGPLRDVLGDLQHPALAASPSGRPVVPKSTNRNFSGDWSVAGAQQKAVAESRPGRRGCSATPRGLLALEFPRSCGAREMRFGKVRKCPSKAGQRIPESHRYCSRAGLSLRVLEPVADLVLELAVLVENERAAAEDLDAEPSRHVFRRFDADRTL